MKSSYSLSGLDFISFSKFYDLYQSGRLTSLLRYQDLKSKFPDLFSTDISHSKHTVFFSHRWDSADHPDNETWQIDMIRQYASELITNDQVPAYFWYDFSCLPQSPRSRKDKRQFKLGLKYVDYLCRTCIVVPLISMTKLDRTDSIKAMLERGWILLELFVASRHNQIHHPMFQGVFDAISDAKSSRIDWQSIIPDLSRALPFYDVNMILDWFLKNKIKCTNGSDLKLLAKKLYSHMYNYVTTNREGTVPPIPYDTPQQMTYEEVTNYWIDKTGLSALFPNTFFECENIVGGYKVVTRYRPTLKCYKRWRYLRKSEIDKYRVDSRTNQSQMYPGLIFIIKETFFGNRVIAHLLD